MRLGNPMYLLTISSTALSMLIAAANELARKRFPFRGPAVAWSRPGFLGLIPTDPFPQEHLRRLHLRALGAWRAAGPE